MAKKETAHRASQKHMKYVRTRDGRRVKNTAYVGPKKTSGHRPVSLIPTIDATETTISQSLKDDIANVKEMVDGLDYRDVNNRVASASGVLRVSEAELRTQAEVERLGARIAEAVDDRMRNNLDEDGYRRAMAERADLAAELAGRKSTVDELDEQITERRKRWNSMYRGLPYGDPVKLEEMNALNAIIDRRNNLVKIENLECDMPTYTPAYREAVRHVLGGIVKTGGPVKSFLDDKGPRWDQVRDHARFVPSTWLDKAPPLLVKKFNSRASAGGFTDEEIPGVGVIKLTPSAHSSTTAHEMGHMFEASNPKVINLSYAYISRHGESRAKRVRQRSKSMARSVAFKYSDDHPAANDSYTYVVYPTNGHTEVVSTGLETLLGGGKRSVFEHESLTNHMLGIMATAQ